VVTGDASLTDAYAGLVPADIVLVCGVCVGSHRFAGPPQPFVPGLRMFSFVGHDVLRRADGS
jgi:hypothetical protein